MYMYKKQTDFLKCVVFDLDGTLVDTSPGIIESIMFALQEQNYPNLSQEQLLSFIGPPLKASFIRCCECDDKDAVRLTDTYRKHYRQGALLNAKPYNGIIELCEELSNAGIQLAVATSKPQEFAEQILCHFGFKRYISVIRGADMQGQLSKADLIRLCVKGYDLSACVMVGDTEHDAKGAAEAGISFIAVSYGFGNLKEMLNYAHIGLANNPMDILQIIGK